MSLFQHGNFKLHSGAETTWRIDCDDMSDTELGIFANLIAEKAGSYSYALCPKSHFGSAAPRLAQALCAHSMCTRLGGHGLIIVDDVLTTGASMDAIRRSQVEHAFYSEEEIRGFVMFARGACPGWITPVFQLAI